MLEILKGMYHVNEHEMLGFGYAARSWFADSHLFPSMVTRAETVEASLRDCLLLIRTNWLLNMCIS